MMGIKQIAESDLSKEEKLKLLNIWAAEFGLKIVTK